MPQDANQGVRMKMQLWMVRIARSAMGPVLIAAIAGVAAPGQPLQDSHDGNQQGNQNHGDQGHGNQGHGNQNHGDQGRGNQGHDQGRGNQGRGNQGDGFQGRGNQGNDFRFRGQDRARFQSRYRTDIGHWRNHPEGRPYFAPGQRIPNNYWVQPVPQSYDAGIPLPPPGYQYGYSNGYIVAYNPATRIVADVMDLVGAATSR
ncbi:MAG: hypothetical protein ACYCSN_02055 [Acidobacteriaceae bacterium]